MNTIDSETNRKKICKIIKEQCNALQNRIPINHLELFSTKNSQAEKLAHSC